MGNHTAGRSMGLAAEKALAIRAQGQAALALLDMICEPYRGCDAEFEAEDPNQRGRLHPDYTYYTDPKGPLGRLMSEAFAPERDWIGDWAKWKASSDYGNEGTGNVRDAWYDKDGPSQKFARRYEFN
jgi:hypothetical protein